MSSEAVAQLHEVRELLASFQGPSSIRRAAELEGAAEQVASCAADLVDVKVPRDLQLRLAFAVRALRDARKAARAHRRNPLTRPLSQARFALNTGKADGWIHGALEILDPENTPPSPYDADEANIG
ncbi:MULTISPECIES: hypothetical protein [unclassified Streptomyces]|uniref:hypothetical protein n=1 Tax=unclassified Streptomyces TaxID=2593676 RepID=UPI00073BFA20|nr:MULTISPECIES: hypothetical protein [unclassified Streptomyces]ODA69412.1 hypothetical protein APS67_006424 [Streptomyces sp. AVP053U2]